MVGRHRQRRRPLQARVDAANVQPGRRGHRDDPAGQERPAGRDDQKRLAGRRPEAAVAGGTPMRIRFAVSAMVVAAVLIGPPRAMAQSWSFPGLGNPEFAAIAAGGPPPPRDLTGAWDPGQAGIAGGENYFSGRNM